MKNYWAKLEAVAQKIMINPSTLDLNQLPWLPLEEKTAFPKRPAIYFAIDSLGNVQYIGRAVNVRNRWGNHHRYNELNAIGEIKIAYLFVDLPELLPEIESALIQYFQPQLNKVKTHQNFDDKREDATERANLKLNSTIRKILKTKAILSSRTESAQVERLILESQGWERFLKKHPELTTELNNDILAVILEIKGDEQSDVNTD